MLIMSNGKHCLWKHELAYVYQKNGKQCTHVRNWLNILTCVASGQLMCWNYCSCRLSIFNIIVYTSASLDHTIWESVCTKATYANRVKTTQHMGYEKQKTQKTQSNKWRYFTIHTNVRRYEKQEALLCLYFWPSPPKGLVKICHNYSIRVNIPSSMKK